MDASSPASLRQMEKICKASMLAQSGKFRESADAYRSAYDSLPPSFQGRYYCLSGYTNLLQYHQAQYTEDDKAYLTKLTANTNASTLERVEACFARGVLAVDAGDRKTGAELYRETCEIGASARPAEIREMVLTEQGLPGVAGVTMQKTIKVARANLDRMGSLPSATAQPQWPSAGTAPTAPASGATKRAVSRVLGAPVGQNCAPEMQQRIGRMVAAFNRYEARAGGECGACGKTRLAGPGPETEGVKLSKCSKCMLAHYCSRECQRTAHPKHKKVCRKPGDLRPGDIVRVEGVKSKPELNGNALQVFSAAAGDEERWTVAIMGATLTDPRFSLKAANLVLVIDVLEDAVHS